ncbi:ArsA family ATPase [Candidatus Parcubacteria bacterium]|nr:ArsA family ATPase [Candidatus Parcubacteria bacterium]
MKQSLIDILDKDLQFLLFGGKGGVGKTTCAAAAAIKIAKKGKKTLLFSTDPAHSLSDSFDFKIGDEITNIASIGNLDAIEIDSQKLIENFRKEHEAEIKILIDRGTLLDKEDIKNFFELSMPGMDELMAIIRIMDFLKRGGYEVIILDTAPTGHTLRLLAMPKFLNDFVNLLEKMQEKHHLMQRTFGGRQILDKADQFLIDLGKDLAMVQSVLTNPETTEFIPVTFPDAMDIFETKRLVSTLGSYEIPVARLIVNQIVPSVECSFCQSRKRDQEKYLLEIKKIFKNLKIIKMPLFPSEIRGIKDLTKFAQILFGEESYTYQPSRKVHPEEAKPVAYVSKMANLKEKNLELILFGGKGGVGKTTCATATALYFAKEGVKTLVFSTDPAHSLSDSLDFKVGNKITQVPASPAGGKPVANLYAIEIKAEELLKEFQERYKEEIEETFDKFVGEGMKVAFEQEVMEDMSEIAPPGLDELMAILKITDLLEKNEYQLIVLDTAPTGHALRLLQLPELIDQWLLTFAKLQWKYRKIVRLPKTTKLLLDLKKDIRGIKALLMDLTKTEFITVTIPEAMGVLETERLIRELRELKIPVEHLIINRIVPPSSCSFCLSKRKNQEKYILKMEEKFGDLAITKMLLQPREVRGISDLNKIGSYLFLKEPACAKATVGEGR